MAGDLVIPKFDENGNLSCNPQFIRPSLKEFKERFIEDYIFQNSKTRSVIFDGYKTYCERILIFNVAKKQWVDGSYTTKKINPNDIDLVTLYDGIKINNHPEIHDELLDLLNTDKNKEEYKCHAYKIIIWPKEIPDQYFSQTPLPHILN